MTGKRAFQRDSVADTLSAILNDQVEFGELQPAVAGRAGLDCPALSGEGRQHSGFNRVAISRSLCAAR